MPSDVVMRGLLSIDMDMNRHEQECTAPNCPLSVAVDLVRVLDRANFTGADIAGVLHVVAVEHLLRLAGPAQRRAFAMEVVDCATRLVKLAEHTDEEATSSGGEEDILPHSNH